MKMRPQRDRNKRLPLRALILAFVLAPGFALLPKGIAQAQMLDQDAGAGQEETFFPFVTLSQERLFQETHWGKAALVRAESAAAALAAENRRLEGELEADERALTEKRATMSAADFAPLALEFDRRAEQIRTEQEAKSRGISRRLDEDRQQFLQVSLPVLAELMRRKGAYAVLSEAAIVVSRNSIDVTDEAIALVDERLPVEGEEPPAVPEAPGQAGPYLAPPKTAPDIPPETAPEGLRDGGAPAESGQTPAP